MVAVGESILHDLMPQDGAYKIAAEELLTTYVHEFDGPDLWLANLTGTHLNRLGGNGELSATPDYSIAQIWSGALYAHREGVDGFLYMSRLVNTEQAVVLFDRGRSVEMH